MFDIIQSARGFTCVMWNLHSSSIVVSRMYVLFVCVLYRKIMFIQCNTIWSNISILDMILRRYIYKIESLRDIHNVWLTSSDFCIAYYYNNPAHARFCDKSVKKRCADFVFSFFFMFMLNLVFDEQQSKSSVEYICLWIYRIYFLPRLCNFTLFFFYEFG